MFEVIFKSNRTKGKEKKLKARKELIRMFNSNRTKNKSKKQNRVIFINN